MNVCTDNNGHMIIHISHKDDVQNEYGILLYDGIFNRNKAIKSIIDGIKKDISENYG